MKLPTRISRLSFLAAGSAAALVTAAPAVPAADGAPVHATPATQRSLAARVALRKVGRPYAWGATGPNSFDCSGLVGFAYRMAHRPLRARTSYDMWRLGRHVSRAALRRGDLIFAWDRAHGHVGIYVGRGRYVHAPGRGRHVTVAAVPSGFGFVGAVRP